MPVPADLLTQALTLPSYAHEHPGTPHSERLEWLGDAALQYMVSMQLYRTHPLWTEAELTRARAAMVSNARLSSLFPDRLRSWVRSGRGDATLSTNQRGALVESLVGAGAWHGGAGGAEQMATTLGLLHEAVAAPVRDAPVEVQERLQQAGMALPAYWYTSGAGTWKCLLRSAFGEARGDGVTKKAARQAAAHALLVQLGGAVRTGPATVRPAGE